MASSSLSLIDSEFRYVGDSESVGIDIMYCVSESDRGLYAYMQDVGHVPSKVLCCHTPNTVSRTVRSFWAVDDRKMINRTHAASSILVLMEDACLRQKSVTLMVSSRLQRVCRWLFWCMFALPLVSFQDTTLAHLGRAKRLISSAPELHLTTTSHLQIVRHIYPYMCFSPSSVC
jgi:hypothetical protein